MEAPVESLNVAVSAGLLVYEAQASAQRGHGARTVMGLFDETRWNVRGSERKGDVPAPLADRMRPRTLDEIVGQEALLAPGRPLREAVDADVLPVDHPVGTAGLPARRRSPRSSRGRRARISSPTAP